MKLTTFLVNIILSNVRLEQTLDSLNLKETNAIMVPD